MDSASKLGTEGVEEVVRRAPKAELHVHLDGAFNIDVLFRASKEKLAELPESVKTPWDGKPIHVRDAVAACSGIGDFRALVTSGPEARGLFPVLDCFYFFLPVIRGDFDLINMLAYEFVKGQRDHNIIYTEVRYAPHEFLPQDDDGNIREGFTAEMAVRAVSEGLQRGCDECKVQVQQILCCVCMRPSWSEEVVKLAMQFHKDGVVGIDVASGEMHFEAGPLHDAHVAATRRGREAGLGVTVHASEAGPAENAAKAKDVYGATRVGHGYRTAGTPVYDHLRRGGVHFEVCPTSSVATKGVELPGGDWQQHPIKRMCAQGSDGRASCSISTDDPAIFRTSLTDELLTCVRDMGLKLEDLEWMTLEALRHAFGLPDEQRERLSDTVRSYYKDVVPGSVPET